MTRPGTGDSVGDRTINRINADHGTIGARGTMADRATQSTLMPPLNRRPTLDLAGMTTHPTPLAHRKIARRVVGDPMTTWISTMGMIGEIILVTVDALPIGEGGTSGTTDQGTIAGSGKVVTIGAGIGSTNGDLAMDLINANERSGGRHMATSAVAGNRRLIKALLNRVRMAMSMTKKICTMAMDAIASTNCSHITPTGRELENNTSGRGGNMTRRTITTMNPHGIIGRMPVTADTERGIDEVA